MHSLASSRKPKLDAESVYNSAIDNNDVIPLTFKRQISRQPSYETLDVDTQKTVAPDFAMDVDVQ